MTKEQFKELPCLLWEGDVVKLGYDRRTIRKLVDAGTLRKVAPSSGPTKHVYAKFQKRQLAQLLNWEDTLDTAGFKKLPPLLGQKEVKRLTGWADGTLDKIVLAGGLTRVCPPGTSQAKFLKSELAGLIGFTEWL